MKNFFFALQLCLFLAFNFFLLMTIYQIFTSNDEMNRLTYQAPSFQFNEEFDPHFQRLNSISKLEAFSDSLYLKATKLSSLQADDGRYAEIVCDVVKKRFYHGYSMYGFSNNYMAMILEGFTIKGISAIVIPDDILKYPFAACSQQSIVMMDILNRKGFPTRKVGFKGQTFGHFSFEVFYNGGWHYFDPNMEPDVAVLSEYNRPDIQFLVKNQPILLSAYRKFPTEMILDMFPNYYYGEVNSFSAPKAIIFQKVTKFLSYTLWSFFLLAFILVRRKYHRLSSTFYVRNSRLHFPRVNSGASSAYYPNYSAQGS